MRTGERRALQGAHAFFPFSLNLQTRSFDEEENVANQGLVGPQKHAAKSIKLNFRSSPHAFPLACQSAS